MIVWKAQSLVLLLVAFAPLVQACSSDESGDDGSERGGSNAGGTGGAQGGAGGASGTAGVGAGGTPLVDCAGLCNRVRTTCEGQSTIDDTWVDVCTRACEIRVEVAPETALLEKTCIEGTTDCTTAILCVSMPTGTGGSNG
jgi:hypothetical protein